jgi:inhibitor of KinA sporulation pathway (predicted exonuclease)
MSATAVIYDTEFTTWEGAMDSGWAEDWQERELVQIGAIRVDIESLAILDRFDEIFRPVINPVLSDFFIELTGITNQDVAEKGLEFSAGFKKFIDFAKDDIIYAYGLDAEVLNLNCELHKREDWVDYLKSDSVLPYFESHGVDARKINSGKLADYFGVDIEIREHNAMDDVYSIHAALKHLKAQGHKIPFEI